MGVGDQRHVPAALPPGKNGYPLCRKLGVPQGQSRRGAENVHNGIRSPDRPDRDESLYRLSYPGLICESITYVGSTLDWIWIVSLLVH